MPDSVGHRTDHVDPWNEATRPRTRAIMSIPGTRKPSFGRSAVGTHIVACRVRPDFHHGLLENIEIQRETLRIAQVRQRFGAVGELDVTQARALLRDTEALIPVLETGIRHSRNALSIMIGRPPEELADVMGLSEGIPTLPATIAVGAPVDLLRRRPDVRFAEFQAAAQSARIGIAQTEMMPRFSLFGSIGLASSASGGPTSNNTNLLSLVSLSSLTYFVGPRFSLPLFNYGRLRNNVRIQDKAPPVFLDTD